MPQVHRSTRAGGLDHRLPPMRLWQKARRLGVWNPTDVDLGRDAGDWARLSDDERDLVLRLTSLWLKVADFTTFALSRFGKRVARLEKARGQTLADVLGTPLENEEAT